MINKFRTIFIEIIPILLQAIKGKNFLTKYSPTLNYIYKSFSFGNYNLSFFRNFVLLVFLSISFEEKIRTIWNTITSLK